MGYVVSPYGFTRDAQERPVYSKPPVWCFFRGPRQWIVESNSLARVLVCIDMLKIQLRGKIE